MFLMIQSKRFQKGKPSKVLLAAIDIPHGLRLIPESNQYTSCIACHPQSESSYLFTHNKALGVFPISWPSVDSTGLVLIGINTRPTYVKSVSLLLSHSKSYFSWRCRCY